MLFLKQFHVNFSLNYNLKPCQYPCPVGRLERAEVCHRLQTWVWVLPGTLCKLWELKEGCCFNCNVKRNIRAFHIGWLSGAEQRDKDSCFRRHGFNSPWKCSFRGVGAMWIVTWIIIDNTITGNRPFSKRWFLWRKTSVGIETTSPELITNPQTGHWEGGLWSELSLWLTLQFTWHRLQYFIWLPFFAGHEPMSAALISSTSKPRWRAVRGFNWHYSSHDIVTSPKVY